VDCAVVARRHGRTDGGLDDSFDSISCTAISFCLVSARKPSSFGADKHWSPVGQMLQNGINLKLRRTPFSVLALPSAIVTDCQEVFSVRAAETKLAIISTKRTCSRKQLKS